MDSRLAHMSFDFWKKDDASQNAPGGRRLGFKDLLTEIQTQLRVLTNKGVRTSQGRTMRVNATDTQNGQTKNEKGKGSYAGKAGSPKNANSVQSSEKCNICGTMHATKECNILLQMSADDRIKRLAQKGCCFLCLNPGHISRNCPDERPKCETCGRGHNTMTHGGKFPRPAQRQAPADALPIRQPQQAGNAREQPELPGQIAPLMEVAANPAPAQGL